MKGRKLFFGLIIFSILSLCVNVQAADTDIDYSLGTATVGTEMILEVKLLNEEQLKEVVGSDWEDVVLEDAEELGAKQKMVITKVDDSMEFEFHMFGDQDGMGYEIDLWEWSTGPFEAEADEEDEELGWFENPDDLNDVYEYLGGFSGLMPLFQHL